MGRIIIVAIVAFFSACVSPDTSGPDASAAIIELARDRCELDRCGLDPMAPVECMDWALACPVTSDARLCMTDASGAHAQCDDIAPCLSAAGCPL